jgi:hypothetical protein
VKKGSNADRIWVRIGVLERIFGVTQQQISEYVKSGMPRSEYAKYDLESSVHWWLDRKRAEVDAQLEALEWKEQETRLKRAKAGQEEINLEIMRGKVRPVVEMEREYGQLVANCRARLLPIGATVAPRGIGCKDVAELKKIIDDEIWDALSELSKQDDQPTQENTSTSTTSHGKRVGRRKPRPQSRKRRGTGKVADRQG